MRDLDDVGRGVLRELYLFRDQRAQAENRPPFKSPHQQGPVGPERAAAPQHQGSLRQVKGISRLAGSKAMDAGCWPPSARGWNSPGLGRAAPDPQPRRPQPDGRPSAACQARFEALRSWRNATAEARGVEPDIVLTNQILWAVAQRNPTQTSLT